MEEICIGGGGTKGIAFLGALHELDENDLLNIKKISGTSIGGFFAVLLVLGFKPKEIITHMFELELSDMKDIDISGILTNKSLMKGEKIKEFIKFFITQKSDITITLLELYKKSNIHLIITTTCVDDGDICYMSHENHPDLDIFTLVCMTTSIPFIFPPVKYKDKYYADGGIIDNLPLKVLKPGSWGLSSISSKKKSNNDFSFFGYMYKILHIIHSTLQKHVIENNENVIKVDVKHINVTSFDITYDEKMMLIYKGKEAVRKRLDDIKNSLNR